MADVIHEGRPRLLAALAVGATATLLLGGVAALLLLGGSPSVPALVLGAGCAAIAGVAIPWQLLDARSRRHVLTESAIVFRCGVLSRFEVEIPYAHVLAVTVKQGMLQRLFGCGDVRIAAPGVTGPSVVSSRDLGSICVRSIPDFREVGDLLRERMSR
jgi:uncharacterized membrane protein YdbT with pleckstrin-like domain